MASNITFDEAIAELARIQAQPQASNSRAEATIMKGVDGATNPEGPYDVTGINSLLKNLEQTQDKTIKTLGSAFDLIEQQAAFGLIIRLHPRGWCEIKGRGCSKQSSAA
ncbi:hypothetical protein V495_08453 [Pseudogymnoascus sp. VKM F-4514 (FW-929)]|nr:hypothetical protein V495_08453 [Pseudogymnoascus sp. VKM F-4514 (FW-929)]KFY56816.1 hypothetical protein V497_05962 [Pseudogymnoascus sp. VKM F-4516 (FW-969)]